MTSLGACGVDARHAPDPVCAAVAAAGWSGMVLPATRVSGFRVYPVVDVDVPVWEERLAADVGPELDRSTLAIWEGWSADMGAPAPRSPICVRGFVSTGRVRDALLALDVLCCYAPGLIVAAGATEPSPLVVAEADLHEVSLVWCDPRGDAQLMWTGRRERIPAGRRCVALRHKEETLFKWALVSGVEPG